MKYFYRVIRISAWLLVLATLLTLLSGFTTTKYFVFPQVSYSFSHYIHTIIIPLVFLPLFYLHSLGGLLVLMTRHVFLNKKGLKIIVGVIWSGIFILFIIFYLVQGPAVSAPKNNFSPAANNQGNRTDLALTAQEISRHNLVSDCWLIVNNKVYNVTSYLRVHPGGSSSIAPYCGKDGSRAFATKDIGVPHSSSAVNLLSSFFIGNVGEQINPQIIQNTQTIQPPTAGTGEDDD